MTLGVGPGGHWIAARGIATYRFELDGAVVEARPAPRVESEVVRDTFDRMVLPMLLSHRGICTLHASAVRDEAGVLAFCGDSGVGKSTLALAMTARGATHFADDALAVTGDGDGALAHRWPHRLKTRDEIIEAIVRERAAATVADGPARAPLRALYVLERMADGAERHELARLTGAAAMTAVVAHAHWLSLGAARDRRRFTDAWLPVLGRVPLFSLQIVPRRELLPALVAAVDASVEGLE